VQFWVEEDAPTARPAPITELKWRKQHNKAGARKDVNIVRTLPAVRADAGPAGRKRSVASKDSERTSAQRRRVALPR
jgi:hypothetical protein